MANEVNIKRRKEESSSLRESDSSYQDESSYRLSEINKTDKYRNTIDASPYNLIQPESKPIKFSSHTNMTRQGIPHPRQNKSLSDLVDK